MNGQARRTRYQIMVDTVLASIMGALVIGFFCLIWTTSKNLEQHVGLIREDLAAEIQKTDATAEVLSEEVAKLRTGIRRLEQLINELANATKIDQLPTMERVLDIDREDKSALSIRREVQKAIHDRNFSKR